MRIGPAIALGLGVLGACATSHPEPEIILGNVQNPDSAGAWIAYAGVRAAAREKLKSPSDDYPVEVAARSFLAETWKELREEKGAAPDAYLDALVRIQTAGFLEEYVLASFAKPGWTIPPEQLARFDGSGFGPWLMSSGLAKLESPTLARLSTETSPAEPGATLPDPDTLAPSRMPCADSAPRLERAVEQWSDEAGKLAGVALVAGDRGEFFRVVARFASREPYRSRGVTWASPRPFALTFYAGFCSIEARDFRAAEEHLSRAVELAPHVPMPRLELAHVFVQLREFERAETQIDSVIAASDDRCTLGIAYRKRGYILFEQGRLDAARAAYRRSLDYDPKSRIAHSELELIEHEIAKAGGAPAAPYRPPASQTLLTECAAE